MYKKESSFFLGAFMLLLLPKLDINQTIVSTFTIKKHTENKNPIPSLEFRVLFDFSSSKLYKKDPSQKNA